MIGCLIKASGTAIGENSLRAFYCYLVGTLSSRGIADKTQIETKKRTNAKRCGLAKPFWCFSSEGKGIMIFSGIWLLIKRI